VPGTNRIDVTVIAPFSAGCEIFIKANVSASKMKVEVASGSNLDVGLRRNDVRDSRRSRRRRRLLE